MREIRNIEQPHAGGNLAGMAAVRLVHRDRNVAPGDLVRHAQNRVRGIADRRMERVADWLRQNVGGSLAVRHAYVENDSSRRVTVTVRPIP